MPKWIVISALLSSLLYVTTVGGVVATGIRVRQYFGMPSYAGVVPEHVKVAIEARLPRGSSRGDVERFLSNHRIGADGVSVCSPASNSGPIVCRLGIDPHWWEILREHYTVSFDFDAQDKLRGVSVQSGFSTAGFRAIVERLNPGHTHN